MRTRAQSHTHLHTCTSTHSFIHTHICEHNTLSHTQSPLPNLLPSLSFPDSSGVAWGGAAELTFFEKLWGVSHWVWLFPHVLRAVFLGGYHPCIPQMHKQLGSWQSHGSCWALTLHPHALFMASSGFFPSVINSLCLVGKIPNPRVRIMFSPLCQLHELELRRCSINSLSFLKNSILAVLGLCAAGLSPVVTGWGYSWLCAISLYVGFSC